MNNSEQEDNNLDFLKQYKNYAIFVFSIVLVFFIFKSTGPGATIHYESELGTIGDYFGGLLNPVFAFLSFMALLATIKIQSNALKVSSDELSNSRQELELTRGEIEKSRRAQEEQKEALVQQQKEMVIQSFDNKFFQMLNLFNKTVNNLSYSIQSHYIGEDDKIIKGQNVLKDISKEFKKNIIKSSINNMDSFQTLFKEMNNIWDTTFKYYFINLYQLLKFIDNYGDNKEESKEYTNMVRAQLSKDELVLLFYNGIGVIEFCEDKYKILIEDYALFEHLRYEDLYINDNLLIDILLMEYHENAFGTNDTLKEKRKELINN